MADTMDDLIAGYREYRIPPLHHRKQTWMGWQEIMYRLGVDEHAGILHKLST